MSRLNHQCSICVISCYYNAILFKYKPTSCNPSFESTAQYNLPSLTVAGLTAGKTIPQGKFPLLNYSQPRTLYSIQ